MKKTLLLIITAIISMPRQAVAADPFTTIDSPYDTKVESAGIIGFTNTLIQLAAVAAGIFAMINLILAGFYYLTSNGDPKQTQQAWQKIYLSLIGLLIIVSAFIIAILVGQIFFGDPLYIVSPTITGPGGTP